MLTLTILKGLDWSCQRLGPRVPGTKYGRDKLWLVGCLGSEPKLAQSQTGGMRRLSRFTWSRRVWRSEVGAVPRLHIVYPGICLTTEEKSRKILSQDSQRVLGWSALNAINLVDLAIAGYGLDWPAGPCRPWLSRQVTGPTLGQRKYLPSCRSRGFPTQLTLSRSSQSGLWCGQQTAERPDPRVSACYLCTKGQQ